jgi:hypothetical protein
MRGKSCVNSLQSGSCGARHERQSLKESIEQMAPLVSHKGTSIESSPLVAIATVKRRRTDRVLSAPLTTAAEVSARWSVPFR